MSLRQALYVLRRRAILIIALAIAAAVATYGLSQLPAKKYAATASVLFSQAPVGDQLAGIQTQNVPSQSQQDTNVALLGLGRTAAQTARMLGLTQSEVVKSIAIQAVGDTNVVSVTATAGSPGRAARLANTYVTTFVSDQANQNRAQDVAALNVVTRQLARLGDVAARNSSVGIALQTRAQSLGLLIALANTGSEVAQSATVPRSPSSPRPIRNAMIATLVALMGGIALAYILEGIDVRIREVDDFGQAYDLPLLGVVPESSALATPGRVEGTLTPAEPEAFQLILAYLKYFNVDRSLNTILMTSSAPGDGKTTVSCHLAGAAARLGLRVLLVDADARRPAVASQLGLRNVAVGLADVLIGSVGLAEAARSINVGGTGGELVEPKTFDVIPASLMVPPNPAELVGSHAMAELLEAARAAYDIVFIDTPPLTAVSDTFPLLRKVDGVIMIGRIGRDRRDAVARTRETLAGVGAPTLGVVVNAVKRSSRSAYTYEYQHGQKFSRLMSPRAIR